MADDHIRDKTLVLEMVAQAEQPNAVAQGIFDGFIQRIGFTGIHIVRNKDRLFDAWNDPLITWSLGGKDELVAWGAA